MENILRFSFGRNWQSYATQSLSQERVVQSRLAFRGLVSGIELRNKNFIDIGFGQGLSLIAAAELGAKVLGIDVDEDNIEATRRVQQMMGYPGEIDLRIVSILDETFVREHRGCFDVVHAWGVLHHTGDMVKAIENACTLVSEGGCLICSIYNRHWSSPFWRMLKRSYNVLPSQGRQLMTALLYPVIYTAKLLVTGRNPMQKERGMDFLHDVIDWIGGYPYEYAGIEEIRMLVCGYGFQCLRVKTAKVPTGCNEFVFRRAGTP